MNKAQAIEQIFELVRSAHGKRVSDLNELEQHAVAFCCSYFPATLQNGKLKYDKTAKETDLSVEFVLMNSLATKVGAFFKKFNVASVHVWPDVELQEFQQAHPNIALEAYPDELLIPNNKKNEYEHLPRKQLPYQNMDDLLSIVATELSALQVYVNNNIPLLKKHEILINELARNEEAAKTLEDRWDLNFLEWAMNTPKKRHTLYYMQYNKEDYKVSYLAAFIFAQAQGIYLKL